MNFVPLVDHATLPITSPPEIIRRGGNKSEGSVFDSRMCPAFERNKGSTGEGRNASRSKFALLW